MCSLDSSEAEVEILSSVTESILGLPLAGMVIAGGDTARSVADCLGASGIRLIGEATPGVPWGTWIGGRFPGLPVATKAGGFGAIEVLIEAVRLVRGEK